MFTRRHFTALALAALAAPVAAKSRDPIRLGAGASSEAQAMAALAAKALRKSGFKVEIVAIADDAAAIADLASGALHAHPSLIRASADAALTAAIEAKEIRSLGGRRGNGRGEPVMKIVWPGMKKKWADAQKLLKRMVVSDETLAALAAAGGTPEEAVNAWWKTNKKTWSPWVAASKNWMKP